MKLLSFFIRKTEDIHQQTFASNSGCCAFNTCSDQPLISTLSTFKLPSTEEVVRCIHKSKSTTCRLDPIPTHMVKACLPSLFTNIIYSLLVSGIVPSVLKTTVITPLPKKPGADSSNLDNLAPFQIYCFFLKYWKGLLLLRVRIIFLIIAYMRNFNRASVHIIVLRSYLMGRTQFVQLKQFTSKPS